MTRTMYDSLDLNAIPANAEMVAYYPHDSRTTGSLSRFTNPKLVVITIDNVGDAPDCDVLDVEPGAAWPPAVVPAWLLAHHGLTGNQGTLYYSAGNGPSIPRTVPSYNWVALWGVGPSVITGAVAHQYDDPGPYDLSIVTDDSWHPAKGTPPPNPYPVLRQGATGTAVMTAQKDLNKWGAKPALVVDGVFGALTLAAVDVFQKAHKLPVDGIIDAQEWAILKTNPVPKPPPPPPHVTHGMIDYVGHSGAIVTKPATSTDLTNWKVV